MIKNRRFDSSIGNVRGSSAADFTKKLFPEQEAKVILAKAEFLKNIRLIRKENKFTQKQLEALTGIKQSNIAKMESGEFNPTLESIVKLLDAMDYRIKIEKK